MKMNARSYLYMIIIALCGSISESLTKHVLLPHCNLYGSQERNVDVIKIQHWNVMVPLGL